MRYITTDVFQILVGDCIEGAELWAVNRTLYSIWTYIRAVFAFVDGNDRNLRETCMLANGFGVGKISNSGMKCLNKVDNGGSSSLLENAKETFKLVCEVFNVDSSVDSRGNEWRSIQSAIYIGNKLVHPSSAEYLQISISNMKTVESVCEYCRG
ncbi:hypothetical protein [Shewanella algae]|uniref:hypothetical protein n=1 Tax=Shewanella algae TaxID=38313 RepID=UPI0011831D6D|nr:hypothetical protein [Shewanella algae]